MADIKKKRRSIDNQVADVYTDSPVLTSRAFRSSRSDRGMLNNKLAQKMSVGAMSTGEASNMAGVTVTEVRNWKRTAE